ncbi:MAG: COX15/CtaA family protein [Proteobacteria bacterium]|nr:COX15/CtaA family protein [Pseudomonadota bacterium]
MKPGPMRGLVLAALLLVLAITTTSAYIRLSQAGLGCADWPACYGHNVQTPEAGQLFPERAALFWARTLHRLAASSAGLLLILIVFFGRAGLPGAGARLAAGAALGLAGFLAGLGFVTPSNLPAVTLGNLLGGMCMAALLWWLHQRDRGTGAGRTLHGFALAALVLQIALGGMIGARHAAVSCVTLPACAGGWWPDSVDWRLFNPFFAMAESDMGSAAREALIMSHRYGAILVAVIICMLGVKAVRRGARVAARGWLLLGLLGLQLLLGAGMVLANLPLPLALLHNLCAALLLCASVGLSGRNCETQEIA